MFSIFNDTIHLFPIVVSIPHSAAALPSDLASKMNQNALLTHTDWLLPDLYHFLYTEGITVLQSDLSRYVIDLNRSPARLSEPGYSGMIYRFDCNGQPLYLQSLTAAECEERFYHYYMPYYQQLRILIEEKLKVFPSVFLLDLHSFSENFTPAMRKEDLILSDRNHRTAQQIQLQKLRSCFHQQDFSCSVNATSGGNIITRCYENFRRKTNCIQIELRQSCYLSHSSPAFSVQELCDASEQSTYNRWRYQQIHTPEFHLCSQRICSAMMSWIRTFSPT